jgi:hypothetical protein
MKWYWLPLGVILGALWWSTISFSPVTAAQLITTDDTGIDVVVVLDDSGSMSGDCINCIASDPNNLRYSAAKLLLQLLDNSDRIAFVRFGDDARLIGGTLQQVGSLSERKRIADNVVPPTKYDGNTFIDKGVKLAYDQLVKRGTTTRPGFILLLTDGKPSGSDPSVQGRAIQLIQPDMRERNIQVLPIRLCSQNQNENDPCNVDFLTNNFDFANRVESAEDLVRAFVSMYQLMKPGVQVVERGNDGKLNMNVRLPHGVRWFKVVGTPQDLSALKQVNGQQRKAQQINIDANVRIDYYDFGDKMATAQGSWTAGGTFVVVRTDTNVVMRFPPGNTEFARTRYVSKDNLQLVTFSVNGPGRDEPLNIGGQKSELFVDSASRVAIIPTGSQMMNIQLGDDQGELRLRDKYDIRVLDGAPSIKVRTEQCEADTACTILAEYTSKSGVTNISAQVYLRNDQNKWQDPIQMECTTERCTAKFTPKEGDDYTIYALSSALLNGKTRFGSVAKLGIETKSQLTVTGLPAPLDIINAPADGWKITVNSPSNENLGDLEAQLNVYDAQGQPVSGVRAVIAGLPPISGRGSYEGSLKIVGVEDLPPGVYSGELVWVVKTPSDKVNLPASVTIGSTKNAPTAKLETDTVRFLVTSVTAPVNVTTKLPLTFRNQQQFVISRAEVLDHNCPTNKLMVNVDMLPQGGAALTLKTDTAVPTFSSCSGQIQLTAADTTAVISPDVVKFDMVMPVADWLFLGGVTQEKKTPEVELDNVNYYWGQSYEGTMLLQLGTYVPARYSSAVLTDSVGVTYNVSLTDPISAETRLVDTTNPVHQIQVTMTRSDCWFGFLCPALINEARTQAQLTLYADGVTDPAFAKQIPVTIRSRSFYDFDKSFISWFWKIVVAFIILRILLRMWLNAAGVNRPGKGPKKPPRPGSRPGPRPDSLVNRTSAERGLNTKVGGMQSSQSVTSRTGRQPVLPPGQTSVRTGMTGRQPVLPPGQASARTGMTGRQPVLPPGQASARTGTTGRQPVLPPGQASARTGTTGAQPIVFAGRTTNISPQSPIPQVSQKKR